MSIKAAVCALFVQPLSLLYLRSTLSLQDCQLLSKRGKRYHVTTGVRSGILQYGDKVPKEAGGIDGHFVCKVGGASSSPRAVLP